MNVKALFLAGNIHSLKATVNVVGSEEIAAAEILIYGSSGWMEPEKILFASPTSMTMKDSKPPIQLFQRMESIWRFNWLIQRIRRGLDTGYCCISFKL